MSKAVSHEPKPIAARVSDIKVFWPDSLAHLMIEGNVPWSCGGKPSIYTSILVPAAASYCPGQRSVELVPVSDEFVGHILLRRHRGDVLGRHLRQPLHHPLGTPTNALYEITMTDG